ncbi:uncharacterized protein [Ambystoma mexicanum]|uniref:uncharacterized protein isoform X2 n=1 Tax=Ambystoma mexicanum TaxID=8296 RepID=UPI0037E8D9BC
MRGRSEQPIWAVLATVLLLGSRVEGQPSAPTDCQTYAVDRTAECAGVLTSSVLDAQLTSGIDKSTVCEHSIKDYACASVLLTSSMLASVLECSIADPSSTATLGDFVVLIERHNINTLRDALDALNKQVPGGNITEHGKELLLKAVWNKIKNEPLLMTTGFLASWFQERLHYFLPAINGNILACLSSLNLTCGGLESMVQALDIVYYDLTNDTMAMIINWISNTLSSLDGCPTASMMGWITSYWKTFSNDTSYATYMHAWSGFNALAALDVLQPRQLAEYAVASGALLNESSSTAITATLSANDAEYIFTFLDQLQSQTPLPNFDSQVLRNLLNLTLSKVSASFPNVCVTTMKQLFQVHMKFLLVVIDSSTLNLIPRDIGCSDFQDIGKALDDAYNHFDNDQKMAVLNFRRGFLANATLKDGGPCTVGGMSSSQWLQLNLGKSSDLLTLDEILQIFPNFVPFETVELLSATQLSSLVVGSGILTNSNMMDAEINIRAVMTSLSHKSFHDLTVFMQDFSIRITQANITVVLENIRCIMLNAIWEELAPQFSGFASGDYDDWFGGGLRLLTPCITTAQIDHLPATLVCGERHTVIQGFSYSFAHMTTSSRKVVTEWIFGIMNSTNLNCTKLNWLIDNFGIFSEGLTVAEIVSINPSFDLLGAANDLTPTQIAAASLVIPNALASVSIMEKLFDGVVHNLEQQEMVLSNLAEFWDAFNEDYAVMVDLTYDVKYFMLEWTVEEIHTSFSEMTDEAFASWFGRFQFVITSINTTVLQLIPETISCGKYLGMISAINTKFDQLPSNNVNDVYAFIQAYMKQPTVTTCFANVNSSYWLQTFLGNFSTQATYTDLTTFYPGFNAFEGEVLYTLTSRQVGGMMFYSHTLTNMDYTKQLFEYFGRVGLSGAQNCLSEFTMTASSTSSKSVNISSDVGEYFVYQYIRLIHDELTTYSTAEEWQSLLENELKYFVAFIDSSSLQLFMPSDCASLLTIIRQLDAAFQMMPARNRKVVVAWFVSLFSAGGHPSAFAVCQASYNQTRWIQEVWLGFFDVASLSQIKASYTGFVVVDALPYLTINQKIDYIMTSDAPRNVTTMQAVLDSLSDGGEGIPLRNADDFLSALNSAIKMQPDVYFSLEVKQQIMTVCFTAISKHFRSFTVVEFEHYFKYQFAYFLQYIHAELIVLLQTPMDCNSYFVIVTAFDSIFSQLGEDVKEMISEFMKWFLDSQNALPATAGHVCPTLYQSSNSSSYLANIFFSFKIYFKMTELKRYFTSIRVYDVLQDFTPQQIAELMVSENLRDDLNAALIIRVIKTFTYEGTIQFMKEFNSMLEEAGYTTLPNANIQSLLFGVVFNQTAQGLTSTKDYELWFGNLFSRMISSISVGNIASLRTDLDCDSQKGLVQGFGKQFHQLSKSQGQAIHTRIVNFLKNQGDQCRSNETSSEWITTWYGSFKEYANMSEYKQLNAGFDEASALSVCTAQQIGEYAKTSGALNNEAAFITTFEYLKTNEDLASFLTELNTNAQSELMNTEIGTVILSCFTQRLSIHYSTFTAVEWRFWFHDHFTNILQYVNETIILQLPSNIDCGSHQQIVQGFNNVFALLTPETQQMVYNFIYRFFSSKSSTSGYICGNMSQSTEEWLSLYFGHYSAYATLSDLLLWKKNFMAPLESLTFAQLAEYTMVSGALSDEDKMCAILARLHKQPTANLYAFLDQFYLIAKQENFTVLPDAGIRHKMFSQFLSDIQEVFGSYKLQDWITLFESRFVFFWPSIDDSSTSTILAHLGCDGYRAFVAALSPVYNSLPPNVQAAIFNVLYDYLSRAKTNTDAACPIAGEGDQAFLNGALGMFAAEATYSQIIAIRPSFDGLAARNYLTASQLAGYCLYGDNFNHADNIRMILNALKNQPLSVIQSFAATLKTVATQNGVLHLENVEVVDELLQFAFQVSGMFSTFTAADWSGFLDDVNLLLPRINATYLALIPSNIPCNIFQIIMSALGQSYQYMSDGSRSDVYRFAKSYLTQRLTPAGVTCTGKTSSSADWIVGNFGLFSALCTYTDFTTLDPNFNAMSALSAMTAKQLAQFTAYACLHNPDAIVKVFDNINANQVGDFMDEFNLGVQQQGLTKLANADVKSMILGECICRLGPGLDAFTAADYYDWLNNKLHLFLDIFNAKILGFMPTGMSCDSLAVIVSSLSNAPGNGNYDMDVLDFILSVLGVHQTDTGVACYNGSTTDSQWLLTFFGQFSALASIDNFISLKRNFVGNGCYDILTGEQLASLTVKSIMIHSASSIDLMFESHQMTTNLQYMNHYLQTIRSYVMLDSTVLSNTRAAEALLMNSLEIIGPKFDIMPIANVTMWLKTLDFVLPYINATMLQMVPFNVSCAVYQAIVAALDGVYFQLSAKSKAAVSNYQIEFLTTQAAEAGSACSQGVMNTADWISKNLGHFCLSVNGTIFETLVENFNLVSYSTRCSSV